MSQVFVEGGALTQSGGDLLAKLAEFLNNIKALKIQAKIDGKRIAVSPKTGTAKTAGAKSPAQKTAKKGEGKKKRKKAPGAEAARISKTKLKVYLKKFVNKQGLDKDIRVVSGGSDTFIFHQKPLLEEQPLPEEKE